MEELQAFITSQIKEWPLANQNYSALERVKIKTFDSYTFPIKVQFNPARINSTGADISKETILKRKCFLCRENRPKEQKVFKGIDGFEILLNPFPIFRNHLTIASIKHEPQKGIPYKSLKSLLSVLPGMTIFFNGALAGASAPDHLHLQAVETGNLPLVCYISRKIENLPEGNDYIEGKEKNLPFNFNYGKVKFSDFPDYHLSATPDFHNYKLKDSTDLLNAFFWLNDKNNYINYILIPRKKHRPDCFYENTKEKFTVSPGSIDMTGVIITPRKEDFDKITLEKILEIYKEVGIK